MLDFSCAAKSFFLWGFEKRCIYLNDRVKLPSTKKSEKNHYLLARIELNIALNAIIKLTSCMNYN